jgi:TP901 family phage tail tape measure protein
MSTIARMNVLLNLDSKDFEGGINKAQKAGDAFAKNMQKVGGIMTGAITVPILGVAAASVKLSNDLNKSMANIGSLGIGTDRLKEMKKGIQDLSIEVGASTEDMADGMYQVVSAFGDGADSMKILRTNAKLAKAGLSSTSEAIALTSAVTKGYNDTSAEAVKHTADLAIQTVALGQTTFPELAASIGTVTPLAASLGVAQEDLFAVMATGAGVTGTSSQVATQFRGILQSLMAPTDSMTKLYKKMGYSSGEAMLKQEGLQGTLDAIVSTAEGSGKPLTDYIGSIEGVTLALALTGAQHETLTKNMTAMQGAAGMADEAFLAQTQGLNKVGFSMDQLQRYAEVLGQKLGDGLAPGLAIVLDKVMPLADGLVSLVDQFAKMDSNVQGWILAGIGLVAALGPLLFILPGIAKGVAMVAGAMAVISGPIGLAIAAVVLLGLAWATNFGGIQDKTAAVWATVQPQLAEMLATAQAYAGVQFTGFVSQLGELDKIKIPEWLKIVGALFTGGQGAGQGMQAIPLSVEITPTIIEQQGAKFAWEDGSLTFDAAGNLKGFAMDGFFGETTGINWDAAKGFWFTAKGEPTLSWETIANPAADPVFQAKLTEIKTAFTNIPITLGNAGAAFDTWWADWKAKWGEVGATWSPKVALTAEWATGALEYVGGFLTGFFYNEENTPQIQAGWGDNVLLGLWQSLQSAMTEAIRVFAEWGANVLGGLWDSITGFFAGKTISLGTTFDTSKAGKPGEYVDVNPPYPTAPGYAAGGLAKGLSVVGEQGPELAFFGGMGADILSNPNSIKLLKMLGISGFADGTGPVPPMGPRMSGGYAIQDRPAGLLPPIMTKLTEAADAMGNAGESLTESATVMGESTEAFRSALQNVPGLFGTSEVTADQMNQAKMGIPQNFADNYLRRLTDEVVNGVDWEGVDIGDAAAAAGIDPNLPAEAILELFKAAWNDSSLFANPENLKFIDQSAVKAAIQKQQDQLAGQMNILSMFGIKDENIASQVAGLGTILSTNFQDQMTPELFAPVGTKMVGAMAGGFADAGAAGTASGNMIGAIQTALTQADMKDKLTTSGESAAAIYWDGWTNFFAKVQPPVPAPPGGGSPATPPGMATGGAVSSGVPYIVGERGQELFVPNVNGRIIPNSELGGMWDMGSMSGGGGPMIGVANVYNQVDLRALAYQVAEYQARRR